MVSLSRLCSILLIVVLLLFLLESFGGFQSMQDVNTGSCVQEGLDTVQLPTDLVDLTNSRPSSEGIGSSEDVSVNPQSIGGSSGGDSGIEDYFRNPSKELNINSDSTTFTVQPSDEKEAINTFGKQMAQDIGKTTFNVKDFLPQEINAEWFQTDLSAAKTELDQGSLIDISKFCQGVDTVGQSLKNPSYDIRGNIPNPKIVVSPFLNSSYDPDTNIKSWC